MRYYTSNSIFIFLFALFVLSACITPYVPISTFEEEQKEKEEKIESFVKEKILNSIDSKGIYESLAYGELIVYKPHIFHSLDSLYAIKDSLIQNNKQREIIERDLELFIEEYRGKAQTQVDEIRYETEHIYCIRGDRSHKIQSEIFYLDHKDSIISTFDKFHFNISRQDYNLYKNYLFEMHFITPRELYISQSERDFIQLFKSKETDYYKTDNHEKFINHTLQLMNIASTVNTVDYVSLTKFIGSTLVTEKSNEVEIKEIGSLIALEDEFKQVIGYEIKFTWNNKENKFENDVISTIEFDPYLRIVNINDFIEN